MAEQYDVFVSYSHKDRDWVIGHLVRDLRSVELRVAIDEDDFEPGVFAQTNMEKFVDASRHVVVVLTEEWVNSEWSQYEGILAGAADPAAHRAKTIPLLLRQAELPKRFKYTTYLDFTDPSETNYRKQLKRLIRAVGGPASVVKEDSNGQTAARPSAPVPAQPAVEAFAALSSLAASPEVKAAIVEFRAIFQTAGDQINEIAEYKALHDQLHELQIKCFDVISSNMRNFPDDEDATAVLEGSQDYFEDIVEKLEGIAQRFTKANTSWIAVLRGILEDFKKSLCSKDRKLLSAVLFLLNHELALRPPQINTRLNSAAGELRLHNLVSALGTISATAGIQQGDSERLRQLRTGTEGLKSMETRVTALVRDHDLWQELDSQLRAMQNNQSIEMLSSFWGGFKRQAAFFFEPGSYPFAESFGSQCRLFESALESGEPAVARAAFGRLRREVAKRFYNADTDLNKQCEQLRELGAPVTTLLDVISPAGIPIMTPLSDQARGTQ